MNMAPRNQAMANARTFVKFLTEEDIRTSFQVPTEWLTAVRLITIHQPRPQQLWVVDGLGFYWEFWCAFVPISNNPSDYVYFREDMISARGYTYFEPREWKTFVDHKRLRAGDRVVLQTQPPDFAGIKFKFRPQKLHQDGVSWIDV